MNNIRSKVFETNSSSTHSISIYSGSDGIYDTIVPDDDGLVVLTGGEFGWTWWKSNKPIDKANYAAVDQHTNSEHKQMLKDVIIEHTGAKIVVFAFSGDYPGRNYSYIDHQSMGIAQQAFESKKTLKEFLFNPESWLFTGNDNEDHPPNFFDPPGTIYKYELCIDGLELTEKFTENPIGKIEQRKYRYGNDHYECNVFQDAIERLMRVHPDFKNRYDNNGDWQLILEDRGDKIKSAFTNIDKNEILMQKIKYDYRSGDANHKLVKKKIVKFKLKEL